VAFSQALQFVRDVPQRGENEAPGKLRGRVRGGEARRRDHDAVLGAGVDVDMSRAAPGLADEPELGKALDQRARKWRARLRQDHRVDVLQPFRETSVILLGIVIDHDLVPLELRVAAQRAERVLVIIDHGDLHLYFFLGLFARTSNY
jgi:hypothetical protein